MSICETKKKAETEETELNSVSIKRNRKMRVTRYQISNVIRIGFFQMRVLEPTIFYKQEETAVKITLP
jgi:hypothetical protein